MPKLKEVPFSNEELLELVTEIVLEWKPLLGLHNWHLEIALIDDEEAEHVPDGTVAYMSWPDHYRHAYLHVMPVEKIDEPNSFFAKSAFTFYIVHELTHLLLADISDYVEKEFQGHGTISTALHERVEGTTDSLTSIFLRLKGS